MKQIAASESGGCSRTGGSETSDRGTGASGSVEPKPSRSTRNAAVARSSSREGCSSSYPQPQCLRRRSTTGQPTPVPSSSVVTSPGLLARGPWDPTQVEVSWRAEPFEPEQSAIDAADDAVSALRDRGSPSHDGYAARLIAFG